MDSDPHHRQHGVCRPQNVFAGGCPRQRSARAQGQFVVHRAHVCEQFVVLHELLGLLRIIQK